MVAEQQAGQGWDPRRSKCARFVKAKSGHDEIETEFEHERTVNIGLVKAAAGHERCRVSD